MSTSATTVDRINRRNRKRQRDYRAEHGDEINLRLRGRRQRQPDKQDAGVAALDAGVAAFNASGDLSSGTPSLFYFFAFIHPIVLMVN